MTHPTPRPWITDRLPTAADACEYGLVEIKTDEPDVTMLQFASRVRLGEPWRGPDRSAPVEAQP